MSDKKQSIVKNNFEKKILGMPLKKHNKVVTLVFISLVIIIAGVLSWYFFYSFSRQ